MASPKIYAAQYMKENWHKGVLSGSLPSPEKGRTGCQFTLQCPNAQGYKGIHYAYQEDDVKSSKI